MAWVSAAVLVTALGASLYQTADLGIAPYDYLSLLEAKLLATSKGVKPDAADDVVALASLKVSDDMPLRCV